MPIHPIPIFKLVLLSVRPLVPFLLAGAIAAMCAAGEYEISEVAVIAGGSRPVPPCGGCRQKLAEFSAGAVLVTMVAMDGSMQATTVADLLPGAFDIDHLKAGTTVLAQ
jgi:cytidine deaminase